MLHLSFRCIADRALNQLFICVAGVEEDVVLILIINIQHTSLVKAAASQCHYEVDRYYDLALMYFLAGDKNIGTLCNF